MGVRSGGMNDRNILETFSCITLLYPCFIVPLVALPYEGHCERHNSGIEPHLGALPFFSVWFICSGSGMGEISSGAEIVDAVVKRWTGRGKSG